MIEEAKKKIENCGHSWYCEETFNNLFEEIERLNNIINELEKLLKEEKIRTRYANDVERFTAYSFILEKLQELKGDDKE